MSDGVRSGVVQLATGAWYDPLQAVWARCEYCEFGIRARGSCVGSTDRQVIQRLS
jgi:hypothetical protein